MHIVLGLLTTIVTILYLLDRAGIDIGWLNPFHWRRRRAWSNQYHGDPIYSVKDPLHVAALLVIGVAKIEGDLSSEQKQLLLDQFSTTFSMDKSEASGLLGSAAHLLAAPQLVGSQLEKLAERNKGSFSHEQAESVIQMMHTVASASGSLSGEQCSYIDGMRSLLAPTPKAAGPWN